MHDSITQTLTTTGIVKCYMQNMFDDFCDHDHYETWELFFDAAKRSAYDWAFDEMSLNPTRTERNKVGRIMNLKDGQFGKEKKYWNSLKS